MGRDLSCIAAAAHLLVARLLLVLASVVWPIAAWADPANILLIVADDIGVDLLGIYGELRPGSPTPPEHVATPHLAALAAAGLMFRNVWSAPYCSASRAAMLTGRYGFRTGVGSAVGLLPQDELIIPRALTLYTAFVHAAIGKWHVTKYYPSNVNPGYTPVEAGFGEFRGTLANIANYFSWEKAVEVVPNHPVVLPGYAVYATSDNVDDALDWIGAQQSPWFLYLAFNAIHAPRQVPPDELHTQQDVLDQYSPGDFADNRRVNTAMLEAMDTELGRLLDAIDLETTTVLFVGDNGTVFGLSIPERINRGGKGEIWEGGINVPLVVAGAGVTATPGSESPALVHVADLFGTIVELAGIPLGSLGGEAAGPIDSVSFLPMLADPQAEVRTTVYTDGDFLQSIDPGSEAPNRHDVAIRDGRYKLIRRACAESIELYDLLLDPSERNDLTSTSMSEAQRSVLASLWGELLMITEMRSGCEPEIGACEDGIDDDGDGSEDYPADPGCTSPIDPAETEPSLPCDDGGDNDGDGLADFEDPGCADSSDLDERQPAVACDDGADNDGDGLIDVAQDPGCPNPYINIENPVCDDGLDNDGDGFIDFEDPQCNPDWPYRELPASCGLGGELVLFVALLAWRLNRGRRDAAGCARAARGSNAGARAGTGNPRDRGLPPWRTATG